MVTSYIFLSSYYKLKGRRWSPDLLPLEARAVVLANQYGAHKSGFGYYSKRKKRTLEFCGFPNIEKARDFSNKLRQLLRGECVKLIIKIREEEFDF